MTKWALSRGQNELRSRNDWVSPTTEYISCSIGFPNYKLFYRFRKEDASKRWCVISISPKILYEKDCLFCLTNSATGRGDSEKRNAYQDAIERNANSANPLEDLFLDYEGDESKEVKRERLNIPNYYPTNPQAEILVPRQIEWSHISKIYLESASDLGAFTQDDKQNFKLHLGDNLFHPRLDWETWSPQERSTTDG